MTVFFVKVMSYEMEHSFLRNDLDGKQLHIESKKRNILTCQFAVENHLSLGEIDKVKKKPVPILTLRKEYGIVTKHRINFHSSA